MSTDRSSRWLAALAGTLVLALAGCGGGGGSGDDPASSTSTETTASGAGAGAGKPKRTGTSDRGARRCTRAALLAALLADVDRVPFTVDRVRCKGEFARSRFVFNSCAAGQTTKIPCGQSRVAAWRLGAKRWRLIDYGEGLSCGDVRRKASDFPQSLCD